MAPYQPFFDIGELGRYAIGGADIEDGQVERRLYKHAEDTVLSTSCEQRSICFGLHFSTEVEDEPGIGVLWYEGNPAACKRLHDHPVGFAVCICDSRKRICVGAAVVVDVPGETSCKNSDDDPDCNQDAFP